MEDTLYLKGNDGLYSVLTIDENNAEKMYKELKEAANLIKEEFNIIDFDEGEDDGR